MKYSEYSEVMKYFRTIDGRVIDLTSKQISTYKIIDDKTAVDNYGEDRGFIMVYYYDEDIGEHIEYDNKGGHSMDNWYLKDIIKQSDTIEELCDEFVGIKATNGYNITFRTDLYKIKDVFGEEIYGAIWTDKGLIYVAKMKGVLPNGEIDWELL